MRLSRLESAVVRLAKSQDEAARELEFAEERAGVDRVAADEFRMYLRYLESELGISARALKVAGLRVPRNLDALDAAQVEGLMNELDEILNSTPRFKAKLEARHASATLEQALAVAGSVGVPWPRWSACRPFRACCAGRRLAPSSRARTACAFAAGARGTPRGFESCGSRTTRRAWPARVR